MEATLGLLADLYSTLAIKTRDGDMRQLGHAVALVQAEAERVVECLAELSLSTELSFQTI